MRLLPVLLAVFAMTTASAATYRWVDPATGKVMFTDTPPPGNAKSVSQAKETGGGKEEMSYATRRAMESFPVILYTGPGCGDPCKQARELLVTRKVPFSDKVVQKEEDINELRVLVGENSVPVLKVGRQTVKGYEANAYHSLLDLAGYPGALRPAEKAESK